MEDLSAFSAKPRLRLLLDHFARINDTRQCWKVAYPLREVLSIGARLTERRRLRWLCRVPLRYPLRRLAALRHEPPQPRPVHGLFYIMGRRMLAG
jgi:hypothetical protein